MSEERLFDILPYQQEHYPQDDALVAKTGSKWHPYSTKKCLEIINQVSRGLIAMGVKPGDKISIVSKNRPEWNFLDQAILQVGATNVPLYPNISPDEYNYILNHAEVKYVFVNGKDLYNKVSEVQDEVDSLQEIFSFDEIKETPHWTQVIETGEEKEIDQKKVEERKKKIKADDLATIIYTSGTTGKPKGVMLSHKNIVSNLEACTPLLPVDHRHRALSFLPLNHVFERMLTYLYMKNGISVYYAQNLGTIADDLKDVQPHIFATVPRLLEKIYEKIVNKGMNLNAIQRAIFFWSLNLGLTYEFDDKSWWYKLQLKIADKLVFKKWRDALGNNVKAVVAGGAALQPRLARVFTAGGIDVMEGYGLTESSPVLTVNRYETEGRKFGTVGPPIDNVDVKIADDGEIIAKGPNIMLGYYKQEDRTKTVIDNDGWLHTGDIGEFEDGKFLKITDRKKQVFKTSGGKFVAPQLIENKMKESMLIEQLMILGEKRKFVSALIVPSFENLQEWCETEGIEWSSKEEMVKHPKVQEKFDEIIKEKNQNFGKVMQVKQFRLVPEEWTTETGELTPTMKLKRRVIYDKYEELINEDIYEMDTTV